MGDTRAFLASIGLPPGDLNELPDSPLRFADGAQYRIEIPSVEGPACLEAVLEEAARLDVSVHRASQGSGVFLQTDDELDAMARAAADRRDSRGGRPASRSLCRSAGQCRRLRPPPRDSGAHSHRCAGLREVRPAERTRRLPGRDAPRGDDGGALTRAGPARAPRPRIAGAVGLRTGDLGAR